MAVFHLLTIMKACFMPVRGFALFRFATEIYGSFVYKMDVNQTVTISRRLHNTPSQQGTIETSHTKSDFQQKLLLFFH